MEYLKWGRDKGMIKTPDIQDIQDVDRFAVRTYYPCSREADGSVPSVLYIRSVDGTSTVSVSKYTDGRREDQLISFDVFLKLEQGYYKSRLVEYNGSIMYLFNTGADENSRNHSYRVERIRVSHLHLDVTADFDNQPQYNQAMIGLSLVRTPVYKALDMLESGKVIGCALSDNFGLITSLKTSNIQIVRRTRVIGEVINGTPRLNAEFDHYYYAVNKLWR